MSEKVFSKVMHGLKEAKAYMEGAREGYKTSVPLATSTVPEPKPPAVADPERQA